MLRYIKSLLLMLFCMAFVTACGGGSGGNSTAPAAPNKSATKTLISFSIVTPNTQGIINEASKLITINITESVDVKKLVAKFSTTGVSAKIGEITQVSGTTVNDFSRPVTYTVVAEDGSTETYRVEVIVLVKSSNKAITAFSFPEYQTSAVIDQSKKTITATLPVNANVTSLKAHFETNGIEVSINGVKQVSDVSQVNFSRPIIYVVLAEDGSTETYRVEVIVLVKSSNKSITTFSFPDYQTSAVIDESKKIITAILPANVNLTSLKAHFETNGIDVSVNGVKQASDVSLIDFSVPVSYKVTAEDGTSQLYIVLISRVVLSATKEISSFSIPSLGVSGTIDNDMGIISVLVPANTDVSQLTPKFVATGVVVSVDNVPQQSEKNVQNFTKELKYVVTAEDGSSRTYRVSVSGPSSITLQSDAGDYIGRGRGYTYDKSNTLLSISASGASLSVWVNGDEYWDATLVLPDTLTKFVEGTYTGLARFPFHKSSVGGFSWTGDGRGCNISTTNVVIKNVRYTGSALSYIDLKFDQYCENGTSSLHGSVVYNKYDTTKIRGPVNPVPESLWKPAQTKIPATGNYVYLQSDLGDYIGQGKEYLYQGATDQIQVFDDSSIVVVTGGWYANFIKMSSLPQLTVGYYPDLRRYPFHNPAKGGVNWSGNGRGCNELSGWFAVDKVKYVNTALNELELRFEQHCEGKSAALRGKLYWSAQNASSGQAKALTMHEELELAKTRAMLIRPASNK